LYWNFYAIKKPFRKLRKGFYELNWIFNYMYLSLPDCQPGIHIIIHMAMERIVRNTKHFLFILSA